MKIGVVQMQSLHGDVEGNIARHEHFAQCASSHQVELLVFPELSLTQYDAPYASDMAMSVNDPRLMQLQDVADQNSISICVGVPLENEHGSTISMLIFQPGKAVEIYSKQYLHKDEKPFFVPGITSTSFATLPDNIAFAICYELSVPQHEEEAYHRGASVYIASVAKTHPGVEKAIQRLTTVSREYGMTVFLSNCIGPCDGSIGGGQSAIWNADGTLMARMDDAQEGFIFYDPELPHLSPEIIPVTDNFR